MSIIRIVIILAGLDLLQGCATKPNPATAFKCPPEYTCRLKPTPAQKAHADSVNTAHRKTTKGVR